MKRLLLAMLGILMLAMSGCGGATVEVVIPVIPEITPPSITSYQFSKDPAAEFIDGSVVFYAPESDIETMTVVVFDSRGYEMSRTKAVLNLPGIINGTINFSIDYVTYPADRYTFSIYLTDFRGYTSNQVVDTFYVP